MFGIEKIDLTFSFSPVLFFIGLLLITGYSVYIYLYTVPPVSRFKKIFLVFLRTSALLLLLFIIFEPVLTISKKESFNPVNLVFIDNSRSIKINDGTSRQQDVNSFIAGMRSNNLTGNSVFYSFGNSPERKNIDSLNLLFDEGTTNLSGIFNEVEKSNENISSVVIVSDGVITEGQNPVYRASKINIPVFTLGIGDSSRKNDVSIRDILYNEYIYSEIATVISASIMQKGFEGQPVTVTLSENGKIIGTQRTSLTTAGLTDLKFDYKPTSAGEKKMSVQILPLKGEQSIDNNKKVFFINVLSSKIKVLLLSGAPSPDVSFIKNALTEDENISVSTITQISRGKILENINWNTAVDSAQIFFLTGFPSTETDNALWNKITDKIQREKKPFFILLSDAVDYNRLKKIQNELPFVINKISSGFTEVIPDADAGNIRNPLMQSGGENPSSEWNNLPPVFMSNSEFSAKPESEVLATVKIRNIPVKKPLIILRKLGSGKSTAVMAKDIWRWKLQTAVKGSKLYDNFLHNTVKWLNVKDNQKQVVIRTSKKLYSPGEEILFTAQVYDASFNPLQDAKVTVNLSSVNMKEVIELNPAGNGIYEGIFESNKSGDYLFAGDAMVDGKKIGFDKGTFNIGEVDVEMLNPVMDYGFLSGLSYETKGKIFLPDQQQQLFNILKERIKNTTDIKITENEFSLWSNEWLLVLVILFFAMEWFIRKQSGML